MTYFCIFTEVKHISSEGYCFQKLHDKQRYRFLWDQSILCFIFTINSCNKWVARMAVMGVGAFTFCTGHRWYVTQKTNSLEVFCFRSSVSSTRSLSGILEPITIWTNCQFIWSGKVYIWLSVWQFQKLFLWQPCTGKVMHVENWEIDQLPYKFTQCKKKSLQNLDFQRLASLDYVLQQVQTLSLL